MGAPYQRLCERGRHASSGQRELRTSGRASEADMRAPASIRARSTVVVKGSEMGVERRGHLQGIE
jgi:hypothetical protein